MRAWIESRTVRRVIAAAQRELNISKQMAPVWDDIFGCHKYVVKRTFGGLNGYVGGISMNFLIIFKKFSKFSKIPNSFILVTFKFFIYLFQKQKLTNGEFVSAPGIGRIGRALYRSIEFHQVVILELQNDSSAVALLLELVDLATDTLSGD